MTGTSLKDESVVSPALHADASGRRSGLPSVVQKMAVWTLLVSGLTMTGLSTASAFQPPLPMRHYPAPMFNQPGSGVPAGMTVQQAFSSRPMIVSGPMVSGPMVSGPVLSAPVSSTPRFGNTPVFRNASVHMPVYSQEPVQPSITPTPDPVVSGSASDEAVPMPMDSSVVESPAAETPMTDSPVMDSTMSMSRRWVRCVRDQHGSIWISG